MQKVHGSPLNVIEQARRAGDPPALIAGATKVREVLGWTSDRLGREDREFLRNWAEPASGATVSPILVTVLWVAAAANIFFGLVPELPLTLSGDAAKELLDHLP